MRNSSWVQWFEKLPTAAKAAIGILTGVIGFAALALQNVYLSVTVSVTFLLIVVLWFSIYVAISKKSIEVTRLKYESRPRFSDKYRRLA